jgi:hypothetical protein
VLYHGKRRWRAPLRVEEYFRPLWKGRHKERWKELVLRFGPLLEDLSRQGEATLRRRRLPAVLRLVWLVFRYGRSEELAVRLPRWQGLFAQAYADPGGRADLEAIVEYLLRVGNQAVRQTTERVLHSVMEAQGAERLMRTVGEKLIAQGMAKGRAEGRAEERAEGVLRILAARGVRVDARSSRRILGCRDLATLDRWFDRALHATRLSDVLDELAH